jgi:hypothetical protein
MAVDLRCPNCQDNLGKDIENSKVAWCGTCGTKVYNERGYTDDLTNEDKEWLSKNRPKYQGFGYATGIRRR